MKVIQHAHLAIVSWLLAAAPTVMAQVIIEAPATYIVNRMPFVSGPPETFEPIVIQASRSAAGTFNSEIIFVADQLDRNVNSALRARPTIITSFANLNDLSESSSLGRLVGEHLMHELQIRAWRVADIRFTKDLIINDAGEFSLSRDIKQLRESYPVSNVVTGTYSSTSDGVMLNVRVIDSTNGLVVSTAQTRFLRDRFITELVDKAAIPPVIKLSATCPTGLSCGNPK